MKESIDGLLESLRERLTNPLVFAYLCAWCVFNWRVAIVLLGADWASSEVMQAGGLLAFIAGEFDWCKSVLYPGLSSVALVLVLPVGKVGLQVFMAWLNKQGMRKVLSIKGDGSVPVRHYLKLREEYRDRTDKLLEILAEEEGRSRTIAEKEGDIFELKQSNNELALRATEAEAKLRRSRDVRILDGWWRNDYQDNQGRNGSEYVKIESGAYAIARKVHDTVPPDLVFRLVNFYYDEQSGAVQFVKELVADKKQRRPREEHFAFNELTFNPERDVLKGWENRTTSITYTREAFL